MNPTRPEVFTRLDPMQEIRRIGYRIDLLVDPIQTDAAVRVELQSTLGSGPGVPIGLAVEALLVRE